ncbi:MAG: carbon-nitrogen hydrolase family protein [Alphaproteobacteria bacterium]|nr:carbon-nitrogen hydrolase family protein [Alphaproteobacteria bacterium]
MPLKTALKVASYQGPVIEGNIHKSLQLAYEIALEANQMRVDILLLPETFLSGYFDDKELARKHSIDLQSAEFQDICDYFQNIETTIILGLNERDNDNIYNSAVVIENGKYLGRYRKATTYPPYDYYTLGRDFPVFSKKGITYGIVICYDITFLEPARILASKGAQVIFCPCFNKVSRQSPMVHHLTSKNHFITRATENYVWLVVSDTIIDEENYTCPGSSCIVDPNGYIVASSQILTPNLLFYNLPSSSFNPEKQAKRIHGNKELNDILKSLI